MLHTVRGSVDRFVAYLVSTRRRNPPRYWPPTSPSGKMFDHLGIVVRDLRRSARLYARLLAPLGLRIVEKHRTGDGEGWVVIADGSPSSPFFVIAAGRPSFWPSEAIAGASPVHLCFKAPSQGAVDDFHRIGLAHGAKDNGAPGIRRPPFYCAFLIDDDGNNVEAGCYLPR